MSIHTLKYTQHWNNKFLCPYWSDLRIWNPEKYVIGRRYDAYMNDKVYKEPAELVAARCIRLKHLDDTVTMLCLGYPLAQALTIIRRFYAAQIQETGDETLLGFYIFKWIAVEQIKDEETQKLQA